MKFLHRSSDSFNLKGFDSSKGLGISGNTGVTRLTISPLLADGEEARQKRSITFSNINDLSHLKESKSKVTSSWDSNNWASNSIRRFCSTLCFYIGSGDLKEYYDWKKNIRTVQKEFNLFLIIFFCLFTNKATKKRDVIVRQIKLTIYRNTNTQIPDRSVS